MDLMMKTSSDPDLPGGGRHAGRSSVGTRGLIATRPIATAMAMLLAVAVAAQAGERKFAFSNESLTHAPGEIEYEQYVTWKTHKQDDSDFDRFDFRHELEFGVTDHLQLSIYQDWRYQDGASVSNDRAEYKDTAFEVIYNLTNPATDLFGSAVYGEFKIGDQLLELEGKIILDKHIGPWVVAYNAIIEAEWEGSDYEEDKGEFAQTVGVSYQVSPRISVGAELLHEVEFDDWEETGDHVVYIGPNGTYRQKGWFVVLAPLFQVTSVSSEADFQTRMIIGIDF